MVKLKKTFVAVILFSVFFNIQADNQQSKPKQPNPNLELLQKDKFLITQRCYTQVFEAYMDSPVKKKTYPYFITSDSLLNAYHVLYQETVMQIEKQQAKAFKKIILELYKALDKPELITKFATPEKLNRKALEFNRIVLGVAVKLINPEFKISASMIQKIVNEQVKKILQANTSELPGFLKGYSGTITRIDYQIFKPCGFYDSKASLKRFYRTMKWLQAIPYQVNEDMTLVAFMMLRDCFDNLEHYDSYWDSFSIYNRMLGIQDGQGIHGERDDFSESINYYSIRQIKGLREELNNSPNDRLINDSIRSKPIEKQGITELRILSARRTPETLMFTNTTIPNIKDRPYPDGLEICALLGSDYAINLLPKQIHKPIKDYRKNLAGDSLYKLYLRALQALFKQSAGIPEFMKGTRWQIKSCNTAMAGWAQIRHTWLLQSKMLATCFGSPRQNAGFVEPNPIFWERMAELCDKTMKTVSLIQVDLTYDPQEDLPAFKKYYELMDDKKKLNEYISTHPQMSFTENEIFNATRKINNNTFPDEKNEKELTGRLINILEKRELDKYPELKKFLEPSGFYSEWLWKQLHTMCLRLGMLSYKQLHKIPFDEYDDSFIKNYGVELSKIMLYFGEAYFDPIDNAAKVAHVFNDIYTGKGYLEIGIGRPRQMLILYPDHNGKEILCKGAVLPYYEFFSKTPLSDAEWKQRLDSKNRPAIPKWLAPIIQSGNLPKPNLSGID